VSLLLASSAMKRITVPIRQEFKLAASVIILFYIDGRLLGDRQ